jgi:hypothetical protein
LKLFGLMVTRNEAGRYLDASLRALRAAVDEVFVFDDASTDDTPNIIRRRGCVFYDRREETPSFLEHEGKFRQEAWNAFWRTMEPTIGDWILSVDADELVVADGDPRALLRETAQYANDRGQLARLVRIPEVFDLSGPMIRTDGYWGKIQGLRFFAFQPDGSYPDRTMGCGSAPTYTEAHVSGGVHRLWLLHLGYARPADRVAKHERYAQRAGHANGHVASILARPELILWRGPVPPDLVVT